MPHGGAAGPVAAAPSEPTRPCWGSRAAEEEEVDRAGPQPETPQPETPQPQAQPGTPQPPQVPQERSVEENCVRIRDMLIAELNAAGLPSQDGLWGPELPDLVVSKFLKSLKLRFVNTPAQLRRHAADRAEGASARQ